MARPKRRLQPLNPSIVFEKNVSEKKITAPHITKPKNSRNRSFRAEQTGCFLLLRSCEVAGLRSRGISLRFIRRSPVDPLLHSLLLLSKSNQLPLKTE
jgi:hypothetical protein